jgi:hypothetical protein
MRFRVLVAAVLVTAPTGTLRAQDTEIFVLGALGALHEQEESFPYETLDRVIRGIKPEVLLLEVTPEELAGRVDTKGRPEYPKVVWPFLRAAGTLKVYAMEAAQPHYGELVGEGTRIFGEFAKQRPGENAALTAYTGAATDMLIAHWKSPADTQDEATDALSEARYGLIAGLLPEAHPFQKRWDSVMVDVARKAVTAHPGTRVLLIGSFRNRFMFTKALDNLPGIKVGDMKAWLDANGFGRQPPG